MSQRERMLQEVKYITSCEEFTPEDIVDHLLHRGALMPPCPIGTKIYILVTKRPKITYPEFTFIKESHLTYYNLERVLAEFGKTVFLDYEAAREAKEKMK